MIYGLTFQEESYLRLELQSLQDQEPSYFYDLWNWFDWITYFILFVQLVMHVVDVIAHHSTLTDVQRGTFAVAIILIWVRLMKNFRAFRQVGPFIVICTYMIKDILRWLFVYLIFYIPYCKSPVYSVIQVFLASVDLLVYHSYFHCTFLNRSWPVFCYLLVSFLSLIVNSN